MDQTESGPAELRRFAAAVQAEPALGDRYAAATTPAELVRLLRADGYDIGEDDVRAAQFRGAELSDAQLSDSQLDAVSGGAVVASLIAANLFALVLGGVVVGSAIGFAADAARKGTLPKA